MARQGLVIKVDGVDGCGKSSLAADLAIHFQKQFSVVLTQEYKSDYDLVIEVEGISRSVSGILYEIALDPKLEFDDWEREVAMAISARRHNRIVIQRLRREHDLVICDRSTYTNYAYGGHLGADYRRFVEVFLDSVAIADRVFWIDADVEEAYSRQSSSFNESKSVAEDAVEQKGIEFQRIVSHEFARLAEKSPCIVKIDGRRDYRSILWELITNIEAQLSQTFGDRG